MNSISPSLETALVFMTNKTDRTVMERFRQINTQTSDLSRCYVLLDASTPDIEQTWASYCREYHLESVQLFPFKISDIARDLSVMLFAPGRLVPGSAHLPLLWLSLKLKHRSYWFVEDDVLFTGDWGKLISEFNLNKSDLLCSHIANYKDAPKWPWWSTLKAPAAAVQNSNPLTIVTKGFFPVYRISARALLKLLDYQRAGWAGHFEVLVPTILKFAGYSIADLNRVSPSLIYSAGTVRRGEGSGELSSLRFRPPVSNEEIRSSNDPTIFHPIKFHSEQTQGKLFEGRRELFSMIAKKARVIGEYGVGESTVWAFKNTQAKIISVDTSCEWIERTKARIEDDKGRVMFQWIDLGDVEEWGRPISYEKMNKFPDYFNSVWSHDAKPDIVLIDGRFRVACFLQSLINANPGTRIVFDDYVNRPRYHIVERFTRPIRFEGTQALFEVPKEFDKDAVKSYLEKFSFVMD